MVLWSSPSGDAYASLTNSPTAQKALRDGMASETVPGWKTITTHREFYESFRGINLDQSLAKYPGVVRDVSFVVGRQVTFSDISNAIVQQDYELCRNVMFVDIYEGKGLAEDERSITVRLEYRSDDRTLIEDEVESLHRQIISSVEEKLAIKMRF